MPENIEDNSAAMPANGSQEPRALVDACITHANSLPESDRIAVAAQVISGILDNAREGGTFRYLIYDRLGFSPDAYVPLYYAGGMHITDNFVLTDDMGASTPPIVTALEAIAKAEPMEPHPSLKRADGTDVPWPTKRRSDLFAALYFMQELLDANHALVEANRRLSAECEKLSSGAKEQ
jgi:hypothetical protein